eukprot:GHVR01175718.1.p1 GENE.GHVR01175718.1~~GHVR01175718.1.p1  ORF type:complete len:254 (-),score=37.30 GHVR01175718.1:178-939(-)
MKFAGVLSILSVGQVAAQNVVCTYAAATCDGTAYQCGAITDCVNYEAAKSVKKENGSYFQHTNVDCTAKESANFVAVNDADVTCKTLANLSSVSVQQFTTTENYCFYGVDDCATAGLVTCAAKETCMQYAAGKFVKATGFKATAYTDNACTTAKTVSATTVTDAVLTTDCKAPGSEKVYAKAVAALPDKATPPADYLCGYSDSECKTVLMCNKVAECKMVKTGKYFKRNAFTNKVVLPILLLVVKRMYVCSMM